MTFLILFSAKSLATSIEFAQWIPWQIADQEITSAINQLTPEKKDLTLNWQDWTPSVKSIKFDFQPDSLLIKGQRSGLTISYGDSDNLLPMKINIGEFNLDQTIYREINGHRLGIRIKAECQAFDIQIPQLTFQVIAPFVSKQDNFLPQVEDVLIKYGNLPQISSLKCSGPQGFEEKMTQLLSETLKDQMQLQKIIKSHLQLWMSDNLTQVMQSWIQEKTAGLLLLGSSAPFDKGLYLKFQKNYSKGSVLQNGSNSEINFEISNDILNSPPQDEDQPQTLLSEEALNYIVEKELRSQKIPSYELQNISSFSSFMHNRFYQFFVWPEMLHYSRNSSFILNTDKVQNLKLTPQGSGAWNLSFLGKGHIQSDRKGQKWKFIEWSMGVSSRMTLKPVDGALQVATQNNLTSFEFGYGKAYEQRFNPGEGSSSIIKKAVSSALTDRSFSLPLPRFKSLQKNWKIDQWQITKDHVQISWKPD